MSYLPSAPEVKLF